MEKVNLTEWGYIRSKVKPDKYVRYAMIAATHLDDILARGHRKATEAFWASVKKKFDIKSWDIVDYDNPLVYCAKRLSKVTRRNGKPWYHRCVQRNT